jgi:transketolase
MRKHFISALADLAKDDDRLWLVAADTGDGVIEPFIKAAPDRFVNVGIAEQNAVLVAAGLALSGKVAYVYSIAPFAAERPFEQIKVDAAYMDASVRIVGVGAGFSYGALGATHHATEDMAVMRALPNMQVMAPGCVNEAVAAARISASRPGPMYIRLGKSGEPDYGYDIRFGKLKRVLPGRDVAIISTGAILADAYEAAAELGAALYSAHTMKPFDEAGVERLIDSGMAVVTMEEHNIIGGLASAVAAVIARSGRGVRFLPFAVPDKFSHYVGSQEYIKRKMGLSGFAKKIKRWLG